MHDEYTAGYSIIEESLLPSAFWKAPFTLHFPTGLQTAYKLETGDSIPEVLIPLIT